MTDRDTMQRAVEVSSVFHKGQKMFAVPVQPAQRKPLTDDEIDAIYTGVRAICHEIDSHVFARAIEAEHGIKENT